MKPAPDSQAGLHLHTSNRMELLAAALSDLAREPLRTPFSPETVVVQSQGMARWLKLEMARRNGICTHCHFPFPKAFVQDVFRMVLPELPEKSSLEPEVLAWRTLKALRELKDRPAFVPVRHYLGDDESGRKEIQIASRIAHLFDQYLIFRPQWLESWGIGEETHWQAELWRAVVDGQLVLHAATLRRDFAKRWRMNEPLPDKLPERVSIFGISALPPFYLEFFSLLGERLPVHLFLLQPSEKYWGDITSAREDERLIRHARIGDDAAFQLHLDTGNRLLGSLGYLGRDFLKLVLEAGDWIPHEEFAEPAEESLLHCIQSDILNLRDRGRAEAQIPEEMTGSPSPRPSPPGRGSDTGRADAPASDEQSEEQPSVLPLLGERAGVRADQITKQLLSPIDDSIQIHSCHSPLREMEVLYDQMLDWFQRDRSLSPRDIVVMMPDIDTYAPFVQAVFDSPEDESKRIPFSLADRGVRQECHLVETFLLLLQLPQTRLGAATVLAPLEARTVRDRYHLSEADVGRIRHWVEETNIRWGIDADHRKELGLPALSGNTWRDGLDRLLLGYAMVGHKERLFDGRLPYDGIEGGTADVLGRFAEYLENLFATVAELTAADRNLSEWSDLLLAVIDRFFSVDDASEHEAQAVRSALEELRQQEALSAFKGLLSLASVLERLVPRLEEDRFGSGFLTGAVTFCGLKPMRSVPFKIVCLVGMNDNAFPRAVSQISFDLMALKPVLGDRSTREDDRYLFLETLLSARDRLYLSYVGQSIRDNSQAPPSVLLSELLDYIEQGFGLEGAADSEQRPHSIVDHVVTKHRLQAFSDAYFRQADGLFSFSSENCRASRAALSQRLDAADAFFSEPLGEPEKEFRSVTLQDLADFFVNPARFLLTRRLRLFLRDDHTELEERESFDLDALEAYQLRQDLVERSLTKTGFDDAQSILRASGTLPLGQMGDVAFGDNRRLAEEFARRVRSKFPGEMREPIPFERSIDVFEVSGVIEGITSRGLLRYRCADIKAKDLLRLWIPHLASNLIQKPMESWLIGKDKTLRVSPCEEAPRIFSQLLALYWQGLREPLKFFPESARAYADAARKSSDARKTTPLGAARAKWEGGRFGSGDHSAEQDDAAFALCFRGVDPLDAEFEKIARAVFDPILAHLSTDTE